jgi:tetratricopeptide (TPR) repeat protein
LLAEAASIYETLDDLAGASKVAYYRSRLYRRGRRFGDAVAAARVAIALAEKANDRIGEARGHLALGNAFRSERKFDQARNAYRFALPVFEEADREMEAVTRRALGQVALEEGDYRTALAELEAAFDTFVELGVYVEAAEAGLHHAVVLASLGEIDEARTELARMADALDRLGSVVRRRDVESARGRINSLGESG